LLRKKSPAGVIELGEAAAAGLTTINGGLRARSQFYLEERQLRTVWLVVIMQNPGVAVKHLVQSFGP